MAGKISRESLDKVGKILGGRPGDPDQMVEQKMDGHVMTRPPEITPGKVDEEKLKKDDEKLQEIYKELVDLKIDTPSLDVLRHWKARYNNIFAIIFTTPTGNEITAVYWFRGMNRLEWKTLTKDIGEMTNIEFEEFVAKHVLLFPDASVIQDLPPGNVSRIYEEFSIAMGFTGNAVTIRV